MKKNLILIGIVIMAYSCTNEVLSDYHYETNSANLDTELTEAFRSMDSIIEISVDKELAEKLKNLKQQKKSTKSTYGIDGVLSENLYALREQPIYLKSKYNNYYLTVTGHNTEAKLVYTSSPSTSQRFYLKALPASSGIPYLLYSQSTNTPLNVGNWTSNPSRKILFPLSSDSPTFNSAWDIFPARTSNYEYKGNGAIVIESQSYLGSVPDDPWNVYNYVVNATTSTEIGYSKYLSDAKQEFILMPCDQFSDDSIRYENGYNYRIQNNPQTITLEESNRDSWPKYFDFEFDINVTENINFKDLNILEYTLARSGSYELRSVVYPSINTDESVNLNPQKGNNSPTVNYYDKSIQYIKRNFKHIEPVYIRPGKNIVAELKLDRYNVEIDYKVHAHAGSIKIKQPGLIIGTLYSGGGEVIVYEEDLLIKSRKVILTKKIKCL